MGRRRHRSRPPRPWLRHHRPSQPRLHRRRRPRPRRRRRTRARLRGHEPSPARHPSLPAAATSRRPRDLERRLAQERRCAGHRHRTPEVPSASARRATRALVAEYSPAAAYPDAPPAAPTISSVPRLPELDRLRAPTALRASCSAAGAAMLAITSSNESTREQIARPYTHAACHRAPQPLYTSQSTRCSPPNAAHRPSHRHIVLCPNTDEPCSTTRAPHRLRHHRECRSGRSPRRHVSVDPQLTHLRPGAALPPIPTTPHIGTLCFTLQRAATHLMRVHYRFVRVACVHSGFATLTVRLTPPLHRIRCSCTEPSHLNPICMLIAASLAPALCSVHTSPPSITPFC